MAKADLKKKGKALVIPATKEEKKKALESALAQIEKNYGKGAVIKLGANTTMQVDSIPTGSMGLDMALGIGGVPKGRIVELYGPESSGKTTVALHVIAEAQKLLILNTLRLWESMLTTCLYHSRTAVNRLWK